MRKLFFLFIAFITVALPVYSGGRVRFRADAPDAVVVGDQFRLSFTVTTENVSNFRAPSIKGFDVLMGPSRSQQSSTQIINGNISSSSSITFTYILMATSAGSFNIPGASIVANGSTMTSNSVRIKVLPPDKGSSRSSGRRSGSSTVSSSSSRGVSNSDLFVEARATKTSVYEQEAFLLTYRIYTRESRLAFDNAKLPDFKGFHIQEIAQPTTARWQQVHYKGRNYFTTVFRQFVLFPQQTGKITIAPARFNASVEKVLQNVDPFDAFFNGSGNVVQVKKILTTPSINISVTPLPQRPPKFSGGVGSFNVISSINSRKVRTNDAINIKVVVSGLGNLKLVSNPEMKFPEDFEVYDPKVTTSEKLTAQGVSGSRVIEYLAIPRNPGSFKIPGATFTYFDIRTHSYKTVKTTDYDIQVEKGPGNASQMIANFTNKEDLKVLNSDIRYIKTKDVKLRPKDSAFFGTTFCWLLYVIPALAFIIFLIINRQRAAENANVAKVRNKKANKVAGKRMKLAGKLLTENKKDAFYDEVLKALWGYISDKLNIPLADLSKDNIEENLRKSGVEEELITSFIAALNDCEFARFAPGNENEAMDKVYSSAVSVISKMENSIKH